MEKLLAQCIKESENKDSRENILEKEQRKGFPIFMVNLEILLL